MSARLHNLAWIRFFAIIFVVLIHTSAEFALQEPLSLCWLFSLAVEAVSREGLCLFFVLSGFLLIKEFSSRKEIYSFFISRLGRILPPFFLWSLFYFYYSNGFSFDILLFIRSFIQGPVYPHLWFMYTLIGIYIATPFISNLIVRSRFCDFSLFVLISFCSWSLFPIFSFCNINISFLGFFPSFWAVYFFCGYLLKIFCSDFLSKLSFRWLVFIYCFSVVVIFFLSFFTSNSVTPLISGFDPRPYDFNIFMAVATCSLFLILYVRFSRPLPRLISFISDHSFGIYLSHMLFLDLYSKFISIDLWFIAFLFKPIFVLCCSILFEFLCCLALRYISMLFSFMKS